MLFTRDNLADFGLSFERYWTLTNKSRADALAHTAKNFAFFLARRLRAAASPRGAITAERMAAIKGGAGLKISDRARALVTARAAKSAKKGNSAKNLQNELVRQELRLRESHRMFTASSARFKGITGKARMFAQLNGKPLGSGQGNDESFVFDWGSAVGKWSALAAVGLTSDKRRHLLEPALRDTRLDMEKYIARKQDEAARRAASMFRRV